ncbi:DUF4868 domain-containing protein [Candidatus Saccharibacteria bacterium]|nr:DUF4868 domain-containing protein [Candidatus Saccharibacteria bacterium]
MEEQTIPDTQDEVVDTEQVAAEVNEQPAPNVVKDDVDVFAWANNLLQFKEDLKIELFLISKTYVLYRVNMDNALKNQLEPLFIDGLLEYLFEGAETGMVVRSFEQAEAEAGVLQFTKIAKVDKAREVLNWIKTQEHEIELFNDDEHDFKFMKGILARVTHSQLKQPAYIAKVLPKSSVMQGKTGWMLRSGKFVPFDADAALRIPADNQMLMIDGDMFVFSQARLKQLFSYDAKEASVAEKKVSEILANFRLSFPEGADMQTMVEGKRSVIKKLQKLDVTAATQEQIIDHASELGIDLMEDDSGAIIIMDTKDMSKFVNLLNDDYMESALTGERYEIIKKRVLKPDEDEASAGFTPEQ